MDALDRRTLLSGAGAAVMASQTSALLPPAAASDWQTAAPAHAGLAPDIEARLDKLIAEKRVWGLHGVLVARGRRIVLERYFEGEENSWGKVSRVRFGPDALHIMYSVSKSIVALVYGVALAEGKVPPPDALLYALFLWPELDLIVMTTAGNYSKPDLWIPPMLVVRGAVLPGLQ